MQLLLEWGHCIQFHVITFSPQVLKVSCFLLLLKSSLSFIFPDIYCMMQNDEKWFKCSIFGGPRWCFFYNQVGSEKSGKVRIYCLSWNRTAIFLSCWNLWKKVLGSKISHSQLGPNSVSDPTRFGLGPWPIRSRTLTDSVSDPDPIRCWTQTRKLFWNFAHWFGTINGKSDRSGLGRRPNQVLSRKPNQDWVGDWIRSGSDFVHKIATVILNRRVELQSCNWWSVVHINQKILKTALRIS